MWHREGRKMATGQYRSAISLDDVAQKTTLARSAHQNNSKRTSKPLEEQCDEFVPLVSLRFQGVKIIDVIKRNRPPKNSMALEPGDLEVDFPKCFCDACFCDFGLCGNFLVPKGPKWTMGDTNIKARYPSVLYKYY